MVLWLWSNDCIPYELKNNNLILKLQKTKLKIETNESRSVVNAFKIKFNEGKLINVSVSVMSNYLKTCCFNSVKTENTCWYQATQVVK